MQNMCSYLLMTVLIVNQIVFAAQTEFIGTVEEISPEIEKRIVGKSWQPECPIPLEDLRYLRLSHWGYDNEIHLGEMIVHKDVADDVIEIFKELFENHFPIERMHLIDDYFEEGKSKNEIDDISMTNNNTSAFFYRAISGTDVISEHGLGTAIDINPLINPFYDIITDHVSPSNAREFLDRERTDVAGMITKESICYKAFIKRGWKWGGNWKNVKDYQHFSVKEVLNKSLPN
jgi:hypothetical protein